MSQTIRKIMNPFYGNKKICYDEDIILEQKNYYQYYSKIYLVLPINPINDFWFEEMITTQQLEEIQKNCLVIEKNNKLGKSDIFFEMMKTVSKDILCKCNGSINYDEIDEDNILILPIFIFEYEKINQFFNEFNAQDWLEKYLINYKLSEFFKTKKKYEFQSYFDSSPNTYWCKEYNTRINETDNFISRKFKNTNYKFDNSKEETNYIDVISENSGTDNNKITNKKSYLPRISHLISQEQFNEIIQDIPPKHRFKLFFNCLVSPEYCHLILNNKDIWKIMDDQLKKTQVLLKRCLFYGYLSLYKQENTKKSYLRKTDTCILKLSNACHIPNFKYFQKDINSHPALAAGFLVNKKKCRTKYNFYGVLDLYNKENKINDIDTFRKRLNIFLTSNSNIDVLACVNWDNIHITGSILSACIPQEHHLFLNFKEIDIPEIVNNEYDYKYHLYFSEYYQNSDVDVLINLSNPITFYNKMIEFKTNIEEGIKLYYDVDLKMEIHQNHTGYFRINKKFIQEKIIPYWSEKNIILDSKVLLTNLSNNDYKKYFIPFYKILKNKYLDKIISESNISKEKAKLSYPHLFEEIDLENIKIELYHYKNKSYYKVQDDENINDDKYSYGYVSESFKFKLSSSVINHTFEVFSIPNEDPWSCINRFHLGQVRGYYDGHEVYLTISALMSYYTNMSPDYRILYGSKDPVEILNKYKMRGYGVMLNNKELQYVSEYTWKTDKWRRIFRINNISGSKMDQFFSSSSYELFRPRKNNPEEYKDYLPCKYSSPYSEYVWTNPNKSTTPEEALFTNNYVTLNGDPKTLKHWMIDSAWDIFKVYQTDE